MRIFFREVIFVSKLTKFITFIGENGAFGLIRDDGFFFVVLTALNLPIIPLADDFQIGVVNFWLGSFGILIVTAILHILPKKIRRCLQTALIILFAALFVTNFFLLYRFSVPFNTDMLQIFF